MKQLDDQKTLGAFDDKSLDQARPLVDAIGRALVLGAEDYLRRLPLQSQLTIADGVPWTIDAPAGRIVPTSAQAASLVDISGRIPKDHKKLQAEDRIDLVLSALALNRASALAADGAVAGTAGPVIDLVQVITPARGSGKEALDKLAGDVMAMLLQTTKQATAGCFPVRGAAQFSLVADSLLLDDDDGDGADDFAADFGSGSGA
jgi:hypothetical protein